MRPHENLEVWKLGIDLVTDIYKITRNFPDEEKFGLVTQLRRGAISFPSNIAEGAARQTKKEFMNFLFIAQGSLSEIETQLVISQNLGYISEIDLVAYKKKIEILSKKLGGLIRFLRKRK